MSDTDSLSPNEARQRQLSGVPLIDLREAHEQALGMPEGAVPLPRSQLESDPAGVIAASDAEVMLICASGRRSGECAGLLASLGYSRVAQVEGGMQAWRAAGLPISLPQPERLDFFERYSRHLRLSEVGESGQRKLQAATVVLVGAGGLGSPAAFYLAAAGVGRLRLLDADRIERSNLQRQILHTEARIGMSKVESARQSLSALNPGVAIEPLPLRLDAGNARELLAGADVVVDGSDNLATRYVVNDTCIDLHLPWVYGAVERFRGQVGVFDAGRQRGIAPCYRCLFPEPPAPEDAPSCSEVGVLGVLPGLVGLLQATEALKLILGIGQPLVGRVLTFDALDMRFRELGLSPDPACPACAPVGK
jgi:sulfur-carrier protein adenylyltransferase/sulfurtransferase